MDLNLIGKLLPEFLQNFKGKNANNLPEILAAVSNTGMLENFIGSKYTKYLPLVPLLGKLNAEGFKGLISDADSISTVMQALSSGNTSPSFLKGIDIASLAPLLPLFTSFLSKNKSDDSTKEPQIISVSKISSDTEEDSALNYDFKNPLAPISGFANRDIIFVLNKYISNNL